MKLPCEIAVWYLLPTIKAELARELVKRGMSQKLVAERLSITQASVSQYLSKKRGRKLRLPPEAQEMVKDISAKIIRGDKVIIDSSICSVCMLSRKKRDLLDPLVAVE
ncbi:MAG: helix-turn-helix domain-containing protein [Candidatus Altiarchaeota archaeon]|nr:helix-turn-helix domain-containing protein [Candidatus Altiarchaeota archaeon]